MDIKFKDKMKNPLEKESKKEEKSKTSVAEFISYLFACRNAIHILHLKTNSYATHKALNQVYEELLSKTDDIAELWQGVIGEHLSGYKDFPVAKYENSDPLTYLTEIRDYIRKDRYNHFPKDNSPIQNELDDLERVRLFRKSWLIS